MYPLIYCKIAKFDCITQQKIYKIKDRDYLSISQPFVIINYINLITNQCTIEKYFRSAPGYSIRLQFTSATAGMLVRLYGSSLPTCNICDHRSPRRALLPCEAAN